VNRSRRPISLNAFLSLPYFQNEADLQEWLARNAK